MVSDTRQYISDMIPVMPAPHGVHAATMWYYVHTVHIPTRCRTAKASDDLHPASLVRLQDTDQG